MTSSERRTDEWYHDAIARCHDSLASLNGQARELRESLNETSRRSFVRSSASFSSTAVLSTSSILSNSALHEVGIVEPQLKVQQNRMTRSLSSSSSKLYPEMLSPLDTLELMETVLRRSRSAEKDDHQVTETNFSNISSLSSSLSSSSSSSSSVTDDNTNNSFRYATMDVPTSMRNSQTLMRHSVDFSP